MSSSLQITPASSFVRPTIVRDASDCKIQPKAVRKVSAIAKEPIQRIGSLSSAVNFKKWKRFPDSSNTIRYHPPTREMTAGLYDLCSSGKSHQAEPKRVRWKINKKEIFGKGSYATVHPMVEVRTGKPCVGKLNFSRIEARRLAEQEYQNLRRWQGIPHIVRLKGGFNASPSQKLIIMERVEPCLFDLVSSQKIPFHDILSIFRQFLEMHREAAARGLIHGDLKPENAAYKDGKLTIYDLGYANRIDSGNRVGTLQYASPEMILGKPYDSSTDLWSIGIIIYVLFLKQSFIQETVINKIALQQIVDKIGLPPNAYLNPKENFSVKLKKPPTLHGILTSEALKRGLSERTTARFIGLLMGILRFEGRVSVDTALELCNQIDRELNQTIAPSEETKS